MRRIQWLVVVMLLMSASARGGIAIDPAEPHYGDRVTITISHWTPSTAYRIKSASMEKQAGSIFFVVLWDAASVGCNVMTLHECTKSAGFLEPGTYTVEVNHQGALTARESVELTVLPRRDASSILTEIRQRLTGISTVADSQSISERWADFFAGHSVFQAWTR